MGHFQRLLRQTSTRQFLLAFARRFRQAELVCCAAFLALLLASRLLALIPDRFPLISLAAIPAVALVGAALFARRPSVGDTARLIDTRTGSKELFLTATLSGHAPGEFAPIVAAQAEQRATELQAAHIVPFRWWCGARDLAAALLVLGAGVHFLPQLDPLKKHEQRQKIADEERKLIETQKATAMRSEQLAAEAGRESEQVRRALDALDQTLKEARPKENEATLQRLAEAQKDLGEMWRKVNGSLPRLDQAAQNFGAADPKKIEQWREDLKKGDVTNLKREFAELRDTVRKLETMPDTAEKRALREQLMQRLNEMAQAMKQELNSPQMAAALQRALDQLDMSKRSQLAREATQGALDSLQLSEKELDQLAQALKDGKALEDALKQLQMAKQLAGQGKLDGGDFQGTVSTEDYEKLFREKMAGLGPTQPGSDGTGPGIGDGSKRPEDDSVKSDFKSEKSPTKLAGGKLLLEWKTKEVGDTGARAEEYRDALAKVKQGVSEAIQQEQAPPGYHEAIKKYFDSLPAK